MELYVLFIVLFILCCVSCIGIEYLIKRHDREDSAVVEPEL